MDAQKIECYLAAIEEINSRYKNFKIFKGVEVDILEDGTLALNETLLKRFEIVGGAINSSFKLLKQQQTNRLLKAINNKMLHFLIHPTSRIIGGREPIIFDKVALFTALANSRVALGINSQPDRLDINDILAKEAKRYGVKFLIGSAAKSRVDLEFIKYGVNQARKGLA